MFPPRFAFLGTPLFAARILADLVDQHWKPVVVVTEPPKPTGRGLLLQKSAVHACATDANLLVATPARTADLRTILAPHQLDFVLVAAYGRLVPADILRLPAMGFVNVHASLLPRHRGASPIQAAILAGDHETGISFMRMEPTLDTGPIIASERLRLTGKETTAQLAHELAALAGKTILGHIKRYLDDGATTPQDELHATYAPKLTKEDGRIILAELSPIALDRRVRALTPWPGVYTNELGRRLLIRAGTLTNKQAYTITALQWEGKPVVDGITFARAYPEILTKLPQQVTLGAN